MTHPLPDHDDLIYREMIIHIPLFTHRRPETVAILDPDNRGLLEEALKHGTIKTLWQIGASQGKTVTDARIKLFHDGADDFFSKTEKESLDILIMGNLAKRNHAACLNALSAEGFYIELCESSIDLPALKNNQQTLLAAGFSDVLPLNFPQIFGWRTAMIAVKEGTIRHPREKDIFNKTFSTRYYNLDMHRAAFALPEFMRAELTIEVHHG